MHLDLLNYLACPRCRGPLRTAQTHLPYDDRAGTSATLKEGALHCLSCAEDYHVHNGIPHMLSPQLPRYAEKMREAQGWVAFAQDETWYEPDPKVDLALPFVVEQLGWPAAEASNWVGTSYSFRHMLAHYVRPGLRVLEIGAGKTWTGHYLLERGCSYHGCDIVTDPNIGLGRSRFFQETFGIEYEVIAADAEYLPFVDNSFDLVFAVAALHHALDLPQMIGEMARVCKAGGTVAGLSEGIRSYLAAPDAPAQDKEKSYGINEHVYTLSDYTRAYRRAGLSITELMRATSDDWFVSPGWRLLLRGMRAVPVVGERLATVTVLGFLHRYDGLTIFGQKQL